MTLLPVVDTGICGSVSQDMLGPDWLLDQCDNLESTNPAIAAFVTEFVSTLDDDTKEEVLYAVLATYRMLESQAEAERMEETIKLD